MVIANKNLLREVSRLVIRDELLAMRLLGSLVAPEKGLRYPRVMDVPQPLDESAHGHERAPPAGLNPPQKRGISHEQPAAISGRFLLRGCTRVGRTCRSTARLFFWRQGVFKFRKVVLHGYCIGARDRDGAHGGRVLASRPA